MPPMAPGTYPRDYSREYIPVRITVNRITLRRARTDFGSRESLPAAARGPGAKAMQERERVQSAGFAGRGLVSRLSTP